MPRLMFLKIQQKKIMIPDYFMYIFNHNIRNNKIKISWIDDNIKKTYLLIINKYDKNQYFYEIKNIEFVDYKYFEEVAKNSDYIEYENKIKKLKMKYYFMKKVLINDEKIADNIIRITNYI